MGSSFVESEAESEPCPSCGAVAGQGAKERYFETCEIVNELLSKPQVSKECKTVPRRTFSQVGLDAALLCLRLMIQCRFSTSHLLHAKASEVAFNEYLEMVDKMVAEAENLDLKAMRTSKMQQGKQLRNGSAMSDPASLDADELLETTIFHGANTAAG